MGDLTEGANDPATMGYDPNELAAFLATAPESLKGWANEQLAQLPARTLSASDDDADAVGIEAFADDLDAPAKPVGKKPVAKQAKPGLGVSKVNLVLVTLLAAAVVIIVQQMGRPPHAEVEQTGMPSASSAPMPTELSTYHQVDPEQEAALKAQIEANPDDVASRIELSKMYLQAGLFQEVITYLGQVLEIEPDNLEALLAIGVAEFNLGQDTDAEKHWLRATEVAPTQPEPWYNLGFLYMAQTPPDYEGAERAWGKVIEIAPDSELAQTAQAHLENLRDQSASPTPGG